ncbi:MAG: MATE family efflux transporter [Clostridia bacterium]|nr:MATE family efflux transporter [Clostridia bacterium]
MLPYIYRERRTIRLQGTSKTGVLARIKGLFGAQDMTVGKPMTNILRFAIPLLIGNLAQQLYSTVDSIIVGNYVGTEALSAIGVSNPIVNLLLVLFMAISTGASILVAQYFGAKDKDGLGKSIGTSVTLIFAASVVITVAGVILAGPLLRLINTPDVYFDWAKDYLTIIFWGIIGGGFYNIISGILRGLGDSFYPLVFLVIAALLNTVLDIVFVRDFGWEVAGAAWATIIAQGVSAVLCIIRLLNMKDIVVINKQTLTPDWPMGGRLLKLGLPAGLTQAIFSLAMVFVQSLTNQMGTLIPALSVAVMRVDGFAMLPNFTFGLAISTYIGQNIGANKRERIVPGEKAALKASLITSLALVILLIFFGRNLINLFITNPEHAYVVDLGGRMLRILAFGYVAMAVYQLYGGILRGAGDTMTSMYISVFTTVVVRVPLAYGIAYLTRSEEWPHGHPDALYISLLVAWTLGAILTYIWYRMGRWKKIQIVGR